MEESKYLGTADLGRLLGQFAVPCVFSLIITCAYNIADQIFVGNGVGYLGNAATGVIFPLTVVGWAFSLFFGDGAAAAASVFLGRGEEERIPQIVGNALFGCLVTGVAVSALAYLGGDGLLRAIGATDASLPMAGEYGDIILAMMPIAMLQNALASIIRADGSPKYAMLAMVTGAVINLIGDPVAIFVLDTGIQGAAWATIIGQFASFVLCVLYLRRPRTFRLRLQSLRPSGEAIRPVMALGMPSLLAQLSVVAITVVNNMLLVAYGAVSPYGEDIPLASFVVIMKLFQIVLNIGIGIAAGAQPIAGYNFGAGEYGRVRRLLGLMIRAAAIAGLAATALFELAPGMLVRMFGSADDPLYFEFAVRFTRIYLSLISLTCVQRLLAIFLQSIGNAKAAVPLSVLRDALLIAFSLALPPFFGLDGILWSASVADIVAMAITVPVVVRVVRRMQADPGQERQPRLAEKARG